MRGVRKWTSFKPAGQGALEKSAQTRLSGITQSGRRLEAHESLRSMAFFSRTLKELYFDTSGGERDEESGKPVK